MDDFNNNNDFPENKGEQNYGPNLMPQSGGSQPQNSIDPQYDYSQYQYSYDSTAAPKRSNQWVVPAAIAGVIVVGAAGALLLPSVRNSIKLAFTSPEKYYAEAERKTAEKAADDLWKLYLIGEEQQKEAASPTAGVKKADITITAGDAFYEAFFPDNSDDMKNVFKSVGVSTETATSTELISMLTSIKLNDTNVASAELISNFDASAVYIQLLESSTGKYYKYVPEIEEELEVEPDASVFFNGETVTKEKIDAIVGRYTDIYLDAVTAAEWNKKSVCTVENVSCPAVEIKVSFSEAEYMEIIRKMIEQAKVDEEIISIVEAMGGKREDYASELDELLSDMNLESSELPYADMTVYINSDGEIIGRTFRTDIDEDIPTEITMSSAVSNGALASQIKLVSTDGEIIDLLLKGSYENGSASGYCDGIIKTLEDEASSSDKLKTESFRIEFENVKYDFLESRLYGGKYTFTSPEMEEFAASLELDGDMDNGSCKVSVIYEGENYLDMTANYTSTDEVRTIDMPSDENCSEDAAEIISEDYIDILMENVCKAAGVSEDELSEMIFGASFSDDSSDDWQPESNEEEFDYDYNEDDKNDYDSEDFYIPSLGDYESITFPSVDLSNVVYTANSKEITIPCKGLALPDKFVRTATPLEPHTGKYFFNDDYSVMIYIENEKNSTYNADVCQCKYFCILEGGEASLDLRVNGIGIGSSEADIEAALGTPSDIHDFDGETTYYYYYDKSSLTIIELVTDGHEVYSVGVSSNVKYME
ncbi:MAG: hypothetical protein J5999_05405 [Oscillospiraceae bacterium]|nr:hypothetical protein [Oscillospiraceae bacterium]